MQLPDVLLEPGFLKQFTLLVGGLSVRVTAQEGGPRLAASPPSLAFLSRAASNLEPDLDLSASWGRVGEPPGGALVFDSGGSWRLHRENGALVFRFYASNLGPTPYKAVRIASGGRTGDLLLNPDFHDPAVPAEALQFPLDELLAIHLLAEGRGVEFHACGVVDASGRGFLFAGQSGDGKTTTARLWGEVRGATILSDDRIIVRRESEGYVMHGTPWHGDAELAVNRSAPLRAIFFLERGRKNEFLAVTGSEAVTRLVARSFIPFHSQKGLDFTLEFLGGLVRNVPCERYAFVPDEEAPRAVVARLSALEHVPERLAPASDRG